MSESISTYKNNITNIKKDSEMNHQLYSPHHTHVFLGKAEIRAAFQPILCQETKCQWPH